ncbi:MAG: Alkaline phosphatase precursor [Pseudomonadota bacterium]|jgi:alkaline phosphatase D
MKNNITTNTDNINNFNIINNTGIKDIKLTSIKKSITMAALLGLGLLTQSYADQCITKNNGSLKAGPLVGHTDSDSSMIWAYADNKNDSVKVQYKTAANSKNCTVVNMPPRDERLNTSLANLKNLKRNTRYYYDVLVNNKIAESGTFKTASSDKIFKYVLASCIRRQKDEEQISFIRARELKPDLMLLLGDNVYSDTNDRGDKLNSHKLQRNIKNFKNIIKDVPTYAIWDDHDFGKNNSDGTDTDERSARDAFMDVWANPGYGEDNKGIYYSFKRGDVEFFMLDGRYFKNPGKDFLGNDQLNWLKNKLSKSDAVFKVLAVGQTFNSAGNASWSDAPDERKNLLNFIKDKKIKGVILHSGDVHSNRYINHQDRRGIEVGYPVIEIISSSIASNGADEWVMIKANTTSNNKKENTLEISFYSGKNAAKAEDHSHKPAKENAKGPIIVIQGSKLGY